MNEQDAPKPRRGCAASIGLALLAPAAALAVAWLSYRLSWWSAALALGLGLSALGLLMLDTRRRLAQRALAAGALLVLGPWLVRAVLVRGTEQTRLTTLPGDGGPRLLSRLYPEPDGTIGMGALITALGRLHDPEAAQFADILRAAYERAQPDAALEPTPAIASYLGQQSPSAFDTIVIRPPEQRVAPDGALVFLHGYAGSFYVYCWEVAQAAAAANLMTLCPATGPQGTWWDSAGDATLKATLDYAHAIGMNRVYLAGLSNGAAGASVLAHAYSARLSGLVLVSGMRAETPPAMPVLVVQGSADRMMTAPHARAYAAHRANVTYREIVGGHLIFLSETEKVRPLIAEFLSDLERRATALPQRK